MPQYTDPRQVGYKPVCPESECKSEMVLRHRKSDNALFWGCPKFPKCWGTRPYTPPKPDEALRRLTLENCQSNELQCWQCPLHCTSRCFVVRAFENILGDRHE